MGWWADKLAAAQGPSGTAAPPSSTFFHVDQAVTRKNEIPNEPRCPECASANFHGASGSRPRCYDCGYPLHQSGTGMTASKVAGTKQAKQVASEGYQPNQIVGRLG